MIWQSIPLMTAIDIVILAGVGLTGAAFVRGQKRRSRQHADIGSLAIVGGLALIGLFYLADLFAMYGLPAVMPVAEARHVTHEMRMNGIWLVTLIGIGSICFGFTMVNRATIALVDDLQAREAELGRQLTERRRAEGSLRETDNLLNSIFENLPVGLVIKNSELVVERTNRTYKRWYGFDTDTVVGKRSDALEDFLPLDDALAMTEQEETVLVSGQSQTRQVERRFSNGQMHTLQISKFPIYDQQGGVAKVGSVSFDITERVEAERKLRESEDQLRQATQLAGLGHWVWDAVADKCIYSSEEQARIHGVSVAEFIERCSSPGGDWTFVHVDDRDDYVVTDRELRGGKEIEREFRIVTPQGDTRYVREIAKPVLDNAGRVIQEFGVIQNITERRAAELQRIELEAELAQSRKLNAIGQLTAGVAHDFNNMLAVVLGNAEVLEDELGDNHARLNALMHAGRRCAELTHRLLAFSRKQVLYPEMVDANRLIADVSGLLTRTLEAHVDIEIVTAAGLWNCKVDPVQLENALINLAFNARDAMPEGGKLTIEASNARLDEDYAAAQAEVTPGQYVMLAITDTGTGMMPAVRQRVFEPFFTTKEVGAGSGLGLSMVYGFVKQSGGHITVYSEPGEGTTIKIYLPRSTEAETAETRELATETPAARGETALIVEDNPDLRTLVVSLLSGLGYGVLEAATGPAALAQLEPSSKVDLLLTDVVLSGGMNGPQLSKEVRGQLPWVKVFICPATRRRPSFTRAAWRSGRSCCASPSAEPTSPRRCVGCSTVSRSWPSGQKRSMKGPGSFAATE